MLVKVWAEWPDYPKAGRKFMGEQAPEDVPLRGECVEEGEGVEAICTRRLWLRPGEVVLRIEVM